MSHGSRYGSHQGYSTTYRPAPQQQQPPSAYAKYIYEPATPTPRRHVRTGSHGVYYNPPPPPQQQQQQASPPYYTQFTTREGTYYYEPASGPSPSRQRSSVRRPSQSHASGTRIRMSMDSRRADPKHPDDEGYWSGDKGRSPPPPYQEYGQSSDLRPSHPPQTSYKAPRDPSAPRRTSSSRHRSASHSKQYTDYEPESKPEPKPKRSATATDAARACIPAGYSLKNWDPYEEPILLLGSVFDANSLGRWIYDFTVYTHGPAKPMSDMAGDLWLLLIQLSGKIKRAEECRRRITNPDDKALVKDFLASGERIWMRFNKILKACEESMWRQAQEEAKAEKAKEKSRARSSKDKSKSKPVMGASSGREFVNTIFGRDRKLPETEKLMAGMRLWSYRFDINCEDILKRPDRPYTRH